MRTAGINGRVVLAPTLCLVLLGGLTVDRILFQLPDGDPDVYHAAVKQAIGEIPARIGDWVATEEPLPRAAMQLLRPNETLGRRYENQVTRRVGKLMIVHCLDGRDVGGHYPPHCYPANGWEEVDRRDRDWRVGDMNIPGREYVFEYGSFQGAVRIVVMNFILRPDGVIDRDVAGMRESGYDPRRQPFGGGQVQLLFDANVPADERDVIFAELIGACLPAIREVLSGVKQS